MATIFLDCKVYIKKVHLLHTSSVREMEDEKEEEEEEEEEEDEEGRQFPFISLHLLFSLC